MLKVLLACPTAGASLILLLGGRPVLCSVSTTVTKVWKPPRRPLVLTALITPLLSRLNLYFRVLHEFVCERVTG